MIFFCALCYNLTTNLQEDIKKALLIATDERNWVEKTHGPIYAFTNEPLIKYIPTTKIENRDVLTVTASGDHPLNIALQNPKSITCFDINRLAKYWTELKVAGIITMARDEFIQEFICNASCNLEISTGLLSRYNFDKVCEVLPDYAKEFWKSFVKGGIFG